ncbi:MAG: homoserine kinase [Bacteroidales bacterium]|nr:homoserine kinase [Bacteroidales bacterium]
MKEIKVFAPASVANVSCAFDILGFALNDIGDVLTFRKTKEPGVKIIMKNEQQLSEDPEKNVAGVVALAMLTMAGVDFGVEMEIEKGVSPGSGMGSSASSAAGAAFGMNHLLGGVFSMQQLVKFSMIGESLASGVEHADNAAPSLMGGIILVRSLNPLDVISLPVPENLYVTLIHPDVEVQTKKARLLLKQTVPLSDAVIQWGNIAGLISGFYSNDYSLIGRSLEDVIIEPARALLIPLFEALKAAALSAGALGSGISGSGPSVFALSEGKETAEKVAKAFREIYEPSGIEFKIHVSTVNKNGTHLI